MPQEGQIRNAAVLAISAPVYAACDRDTMKRLHVPGRTGNTGKSDLTGKSADPNVTGFCGRYNTGSGCR
jgi:hypothetical protein